MVIPPSCVQSVEMRVSQSGLVGRNCCQTIISASPQSSQKGVASHRKGARNRPCLQLARKRPSAIDWSSARWARWPELRWHLPLAVFELGKQLVYGRVALAIFLDDGLTKLRDSTVFRTTAVPPGDKSRLPCAGRTDSDFLRLSRSTPVQSVNPQTPSKPRARLNNPNISTKYQHHGRRNIAHTGSFLSLPTTFLHSLLLSLQIHIVPPKANIASISAEIFACHTCHLSESPIHPGHTRRNMGGHLEGCS